MQLNNLYPTQFMLLLVLALSTACDPSGKDKYPTPTGYDLNNPVVTKLSDRLNEISGLAYYPKDSSIFAIIDEAGMLYKLVPGEKMDVHHWRFSKSGDYEDIVLRDSIFYVMKSKGDIIAFRFDSPDSVASDEYDIPLTDKNEFESLYYDEQLGKLVMICKDCGADEKSSVSSWMFDPVTREFSQGSITLDAPTILAELKSDQKRFKPSAAAIHPLTGELFIISSVNKALVIADRLGKVRKIYPLNPKTHKQPEGIAFSPSGDMFISNEAAGEGLPNLLYYKYKKTGHGK